MDLASGDLFSVGRSPIGRTRFLYWMSSQIVGRPPYVLSRFFTVIQANTSAWATTSRSVRTFVNSMTCARRPVYIASRTVRAPNSVTTCRPGSLSHT
ncbi:hypothetical protein RHA1_ro02896 [Rhodococcus jostii RHA1]|uniref:Uncharacterized protein n=1 Tax=Rhodococcus jostii (strain RHA1) TaxID=101510 RepID=Q0SCN5_RHOJR|nr:hypothetical protein RHA1_ro02896 [Rhodococcus jostii RHA1]